MTGETQNAITILVGVAALRLSLTDAYLRYVKDALRPWLIVAGVLLVVIGAVGLLRRKPAAEPEPEAEAELLDHADHEHGHGPRVAWLLVLPVLTIFLVAPAPLGAFAARRNDIKLTAPKAKFPALPAEVGGAVPLTLREYTLRSHYDDTGSLKDRTVRLTGFLTPQGNDVLLTRFVLSCCAADGVPIKVRLVDFRGAPTADTWLEVEGTWVEPDRSPQGEVLTARPAALKVRSVKPIPEPKRPYEE